MPSVTSVLLTVLLVCATTLGQSPPPASQTFHVQGTITDQSGTIFSKAKGAFKSEQFEKTVATNERGVYETHLPFGNYTMTAQVLGFRPYHRPVFRVTATETIAFDVTLPVQPT